MWFKLKTYNFIIFFFFLNEQLIKEYGINLTLKIFGKKINQKIEIKFHTWETRIFKLVNLTFVLTLATYELLSFKSPLIWTIFNMADRKSINGQPCLLFSIPNHSSSLHLYLCNGFLLNSQLTLHVINQHAFQIIFTIDILIIYHNTTSTEINYKSFQYSWLQATACFWINVDD